jgi:4'-phosphopantetheinyl transferase
MQHTSFFRFEIVEKLLRQPANNGRRLASDEIVITMLRPEEAAEPEDRSMLVALLSNEERERLVRFRFESDRLLFLISRALVRITLSRHEDVQPEAWRFQVGSHGRPEIALPRSRLRFSLSRRRGLAACAVVLDRDIGLDVEYVSNLPIDVVEHFFSPRERFDLNSNPLEARKGLFFEYWTLKEAYIKARGLGLSLPMDQFSLVKGVDDRWRVVSDSQLPDESERWLFWSWRMGSDHQMALAIDQTVHADKN